MPYLKEFYESHTEFEKGVWKKCISGLESSEGNLKFKGEFREDKPLFYIKCVDTRAIFINLDCERHETSGLTLECCLATKHLCHDDKLSMCQNEHEIKNFKREIKIILLYELSFFQPFPYDSTPIKNKKWLHTLIMYGNRISLPPEVVLHISSFMRNTEMEKDD